MLNWLKRFWNWLTKAGMLWLCLFVIILALLIPLAIPIQLEARLRISGLLLQLSGLMTVAWGISETRRLFGRPSVFSHALQWFRLFPPFRPKPINVTIQAGVGGISFSGRANVWMNAAPDANIEQRVHVLEQNLLRVNQETIQLQERLDAEARTRHDELSKEREGREQADKEIHSKLESTETGGLYLSLVGASWLLLGLILGTVSPEIVALLAWWGLRCA